MKIAGMDIQKPINSFIVVQRGKKTRTHGGLILAPTSTEKSLFCKVLKTGTMRRLPGGAIEPQDVHEGDIVVLRTWSGKDIAPDIKIVEQEWIEAIIDNPSQEILDEFEDESK